MTAGIYEQPGSPTSCLAPLPNAEYSIELLQARAIV